MPASPAPLLDRDASESALVRRRLPIRGQSALLTCMHASLDCGALAGCWADHTQIIRNPGARPTDDAIRSLLLAYELFGARTWFIVQHTDCGLTLVSEDVTENLWPSLTRAGKGRGLTRADRLGSPYHDAGIGRFRLEDHSQILAEDLARLRRHPLRPGEVSIRGFLQDSAFGLREVTPEPSP